MVCRAACPSRALFHARPNCRARAHSPLRATAAHHGPLSTQSCGRNLVLSRYLSGRQRVPSARSGRDLALGAVPERAGRLGECPGPVRKRAYSCARRADRRRREPHLVRLQTSHTPASSGAAGRRRASGTPGPVAFAERSSVRGDRLPGRAEARVVSRPSPDQPPACLPQLPTRLLVPGMLHAGGEPITPLAARPPTLAAGGLRTAVRSGGDLELRDETWLALCADSLTARDSNGASEDCAVLISAEWRRPGDPEFPLDVQARRADRELLRRSSRGRLDERW